MILLNQTPHPVLDEWQTFAAALVCDHCQQPIRKAQDPEAQPPVVLGIWEEDEDRVPGANDVWHLHGQCEIPMTEKLQKEHGRKLEEQKSEAAYREDIQRHLLQLIEEVGLTPEELIAYRDGESEGG